MKLKKYQKEYNRFNKFSRKAYSILLDLYKEINNDKNLKAKKDISFVLISLDTYIKSYFDIIDSINDIDFTNLKDTEPEKLNNLLILPVYEDENIYVPSNFNIGDIFNTPE